MLLFIAINLCLGLWVRSEYFIPEVFSSAYIFYIFGSITMLMMAYELIRPNNPLKKLLFDLFACSVTVVWFSYWPPFFSEGSPVFTVFPLYFSLMAAVISLFFSQQQIVDLNRHLVNPLKAYLTVIKPIYLMVGVCIALAFPSHFLLFPVLMTLFVVRYAFFLLLDL